MATTLQQHCAPATPTATAGPPTKTQNPKIRHAVYSKYRELLGSYNDKANAYIETLPAYAVQKDYGFNAMQSCLQQQQQQQPQQKPNRNGDIRLEYGGPTGQRNYEAPACVQNAMMTKDKKPFTYTPGGIDLSQIKSQRMAQRLARNAQAEGTSGASQMNRPTQPTSPGSGNVSANMGAAAMGMPFQVLPPPPPPPQPGMNAGKNSTAAVAGAAPPPPPPPTMSSNTNTSTLAPPSTNGGANGSKPGSPNAARKSPTPQRFEPPPMGFRPEIKIPPNPMASLRKVPPPVEKNTFWKDAYIKERSKSPMVGENDRSSSPNDNGNGNGYGNNYPATNYGENLSNNNHSNNINDNNNDDGFRKSAPAPTQLPELSRFNSPLSQSPQPAEKPQQQLYSSQTPPAATTPPIQAQPPRQEFRSVAVPQSPSVNVYTRPANSPGTSATDGGSSSPNLPESPYRYNQSVQQQPQQRSPQTISPLAQQHSPITTPPQSSPASPPSAQQSPANATVPWRTQRAQPQGATFAGGQQQQQQQQQQPSYQLPQQQQQQQQQSNQPLYVYNNVSSQPQSQRDVFSPSRDQQGSKPTNVGSLYIAPLAPTGEPQAPSLVRHQMQQQQQQQRDSPVRQFPPSQPAQPQLRAPVNWMRTQPPPKEQPEWVRPEENGNVVPSSLHRLKSPPPPQAAAAPQQHYTPQQQQQQPYQQPPQYQSYQQPMYQPSGQDQGYANFGHQPSNTGLRLQVNATSNATTSASGPKERIVPIQLEQTPTQTPSSQPSFNTQQVYNAGNQYSAPAGYVMRSPNQFVDQGYNNFGQQQQYQHQQQQQQQQQQQLPQAQQQRREPSLQRVITPNAQVSTGPGGVRTHIIPIAVEGDGARGPISNTPIMLQNDPRTPPVQSKSFRILQKITDTAEDNSTDDVAKPAANNQIYIDAEPQLQRPQYARQMSAQLAHNSPTVEQMKRMQISHDQQPSWNPQDMPQQYIHPSEQHVPEPKKYTGSAIPSRSFKILQAMTTPENADNQNFAEREVTQKSELNDNHKIENIIENENNEQNIDSDRNSCEFENLKSHTTEIPLTTTSSSSMRAQSPIPSSSASSLNSDTSYATQPNFHPPYGYSYPYPWYPPIPPPPSNGDQMPHWPYPPLPYVLPPPPPPPPSSNGQVQSTEQQQQQPPTNYPPYSPYPPYYAMYPPPMHNLPDCDTHNMQYSPMYPPPPPYYPHYPYPVAPSYSQSSTSSRSSSVLPDIIVTPSTDDMPSQVILQHHVKLEKPDRPSFPHDVQITEVATEETNPKPERNQREGSVIDVLSKRLEDMCMTKNISRNAADKSYAGEWSKEFEDKSPIDNTSPVQRMARADEVQVAPVQARDESSSDEDSSDDDSEVTPQYTGGKNNLGLQTIKSVSNIQIYNNPTVNGHAENGDQTSDDGDSDGEMQDEGEENVKNVIELVLDENLSDNENDENLSVIYEEESEMDVSSDQLKTAIRRGGSSTSEATSANLDKQIEEDDSIAEVENSNSVVVRLPLRFSFSRSSNNEDIATVEVGDSQIEEKRNAYRSEGKPNSFVIAQVQNDSEDEQDDDCDVSVTISLTGSGASSRSASVDRKYEPYNLNVVEDIAVPEVDCDAYKSSSEDVSASFSLNMRNKFLGETITNGVTNNISDEIVAEEKETSETVETKEIKAPEELDFFATLRATKLQAQKMMEQSNKYWGKPASPKVEEKSQPEETKELPKAEPQEEKQSEEIDDIWADRNDDDDMPTKITALKPKNTIANATNDFWSTVAEATKSSPTPTPEETPAAAEEESEEVDFWAVIEKSNSQEDDWVQKKSTVACTQYVREQIEEVKYCPEQFYLLVESLPKSQRPGISYQAEKVEEVKEEPTSEIEVRRDFWASYKPPQTREIEESKLKQDEEEASDSEEEEAVEVPKNSQKAEEEQEDVDFWAEIKQSDTPSKPEFDPTKYPAEPREVDTDEEIDFWAEIEAKKNRENGNENDVDDNGTEVNFYQAASFWAKREYERRNSIDETPYTPVQPKPFAARMPDEPAAMDDDKIWSVLEAARGEEPIIIDPAAQESDPIVVNGNADDDDITAETASVHEPVIANVWPQVSEEPQQNTEEQTGEIDFWAEIEGKKEEVPASTQQSEDNEEKSKPKDELDIKRSNYRKAMTFFTTSIDDQKNPSSSGEAKKTRKAKKPRPLSLQVERSDDADNSVSNLTPTNCDSREATRKSLPEVYVEPLLQKKLLPNGLPDLGVSKSKGEQKISVRDRIFAFESVSIDQPSEDKKPDFKTHSLSVDSCTPKSSLSRNNSSQRSESEMEEDDSGVTDMNKLLSEETDTESDSFPELRKMTKYQRAATHSRLFKLLQDETDIADDDKTIENQQLLDEFHFKPSRRKIVHNVSITRKQNPNAISQAETMTQRRERLSLPLRKNTSIDADNPSTPNSPASPILGQPESSRMVSDQLVNELVQSLLLKRDSGHLRNLPMEKLQAAAKRVLEEELDSLENTSVDSTPAPTPNDNKGDKSYADYYDSWSNADGVVETMPPKGLRAIQEPNRRTAWSVRCPRVLSSKTINRDLARVTESPEIFTRNSKSPECFRQSREGSVNRWKNY